MRTAFAGEVIETARDLARKAARRLMALRGTTLQRSHKADHSLVTNADHEADQIIRSGLQRAFPDHAILTEESGWSGPRRAEFVWVVDPLDGTRAYAKGIEGFSVMIGLLREGRPFAGVVVDPLEGHLYSAVQGEGAIHEWRGKRWPLRCSTRCQRSEMPVITSTGFPEEFRKRLMRHLTGPWRRPVNSVGIKAGLVARQAADIYINHHTVHLWDVCAPQIILEEAGGTITLLDGHSISYEFNHGDRLRGPTLATNGQIHNEVLKIVNKTIAATATDIAD